jgi:hypothetical protein
MLARRPCANSSLLRASDRGGGKVGTAREKEREGEGKREVGRERGGGQGMERGFAAARRCCARLCKVEWSIDGSKMAGDIGAGAGGVEGVWFSSVRGRDASRMQYCTREGHIANTVLYEGGTHRECSTVRGQLDKPPLDKPLDSSTTRTCSTLLQGCECRPARLHSGLAILLVASSRL